MITDDGIPTEYAQTVVSQSKEAYCVTVPQGETSKGFATLERICRELMERHFSRKDCIVAVGGGVVGDLSGFAASCYMRGIDFYNIPTTVLSQVDSSIGGKTAINLDTVKNIVGAFYQPKRVLIDLDVLKSLPARQISNGLAEAIKMGLTSDASLFELFEREDYLDQMELIIEKSLKVKRDVVEQDETEQGLRKMLNFGHTFGHGYENVFFEKLYHGECVALGMLALCSDKVKARLLPVLQRVNLPTSVSCDKNAVWDAVTHDKKFSAGKASFVYVGEVGQGEIQDLPIPELREKFFRE